MIMASSRMNVNVYMNVNLYCTLSFRNL